MVIGGGLVAASAVDAVTIAPANAVVAVIVDSTVAVSVGVNL